MRDKASLGLGIGAMVLAAFAVVTALGWPWKAALFPLVIGGSVFCLAAAEVLWGLLGKTSAPQAPEFRLSEDPPAPVGRARSLLAAGWMAGFFAGIVLIGFPLAVALFVLLYLRFQGRESWTLALTFTFATWAGFYALFVGLLHLPFPAGWIQTWLGLA